MEEVLNEQTLHTSKSWRMTSEVNIRTFPKSLEGLKSTIYGMEKGWTKTPK